MKKFIISVLSKLKLNKIKSLPDAKVGHGTVSTNT